MPVIKIRRGTTQQWASSTRILQVGELGIDTTLNKIKAGNGVSTWANLSFITSNTAEIAELAQDAIATALANGTHSNIQVSYNDNDNTISLSAGPDVVTTTSLSNTLTNATTGYVPIADVGQADGVASLDSNGKIPDSEIPSTIARDSELFSGSYNDLSSKPDLTVYATKSAPTFTGTVTSSNDLVVDGNLTVNGTTFNASSTSIVIEDNMLQLAHQNPANTTDLGIIVGYNDGAAKHAGIVRDVSANTWKLFKGVTTEPTTTVDFTQGSLDDLQVAGLTATSITIGDVSNTEIQYLNNVTSNIQTQLDSKAAIESPTFTGTVGGISKSMVGLGNVDNTSDANKPVSTATQTALDAKSNVLITTNAQSSGYTLVTSDSGKLIEMSGGGTLTITDSSSFPVGFTCDILQTGSSQVTIAGDGFTPNATPGLKLRAQWSSASLVKRALNSWVVMGDLST